MNVNKKKIINIYLKKIQNYITNQQKRITIIEKMNKY